LSDDVLVSSVVSIISPRTHFPNEGSSKTYVSGGGDEGDICDMIRRDFASRTTEQAVSIPFHCGGAIGNWSAHWYQDVIADHVLIEVQLVLTECGQVVPSAGRLVMVFARCLDIALEFGLLV
jgi:hypothetical protein